MMSLTRAPGRQQTSLRGGSVRQLGPSEDARAFAEVGRCDPVHLHGLKPRDVHYCGAGTSFPLLSPEKHPTLHYCFGFFTAGFSRKKLLITAFVVRLHSGAIHAAHTSSLSTLPAWI